MTIPQDKLIHFLGGFCVTAGLSLLGHPVVGLIACIIIGAVKEVWDRYNPPHQSDLLDAISTIAGGFLAFLIGVIHGLLG